MSDQEAKARESLHQFRCVLCRRVGTRQFVARTDDGRAVCQNASACRRRNPKQPVGS